jgi:hypothetical protein
MTKNMGAIKVWFRGLFVLLFGMTLPLFGQTNFWTSSSSGSWQQSAWSLGVLPNSAHDVLITNNGVKTITISLNTALYYHNSTTVKSLALSGPNTLLLQCGNAHAFQVLENTSVKSGATLELTNGNFITPATTLDGGRILIETTNQNLGQLTLASTSLIDFGSSPGQKSLIFSNCAASGWAPATLIVTNWNGAYTGGSRHQLFFVGTPFPLYSYQQAQIIFRNPVGLAPGDYPARFVGDELVPVAFNSWTNASSGNWEDSSWSMGVLPSAVQSVAITNAPNPGFVTKSVSITANTVVSNSSALTVNNLTLGASNSLFLNHAGTNTPLSITDGLVLNGGATLTNVGSALVVGGLTGRAIALNGGSIVQKGGLVRTTAWSTFDGDYTLMDGVAELQAVGQNSGTFRQYGGVAKLYFACKGGDYQLIDGLLRLAFDPLDACNFVQSGGTNFIVGGGFHLAPSDVLDTEPRKFTLNGGCVFTDQADIGWAGHVTQTAGSILITNDLDVYGIGDGRGHPVSWTYGTFEKSAGTLSAGTLTLEGYAARFNQTGGRTTFGDINFVGGSNQLVSSFELGGGTIACSNLFGAGGTIDVDQSGGSLIVSNTLLFGGYFVGYQYYSYKIPARFPRYNFSAGTLSAKNIQIDAEWIIGSSPISGRVTNIGFLQLSGNLHIGDANERLGKFVLSGNALINFTGTNTVLRFADSSAQSWINSGVLTVSNWNGSLTGNGNHQLKFGTTASALTAAQLGQIRFVNVVGFPSGSYPAKILSSGEIVPNPTVIAAAASNQSLVITWPDNSFTLQCATNILGPWANVVGCSSPYTNVATGPCQFFRLLR